MLNIIRNAYVLAALFIGLCTTQANAFEIQSLNGIWGFKTDPFNDGIEQSWYSASSAQKNWDQLVVPGNWDTESTYADYTGVAWYKTEFSTPQDTSSRLIRLVFESVYNDSIVWLNGKKIGHHALGFLPFHFDINRHLNKKGVNTLVVRVDNTFKRGAIWNWGGIRRPVWLEISDKTRLEHQHITATPDLTKGTATITGDLSFSHHSKLPASVSYDIAISPKNAPKKIIASANGTVTFQSNGTKNASYNVNLKSEDVELWDYNHPNLYLSTITIKKNNKTIHRQTDRFGIRKLEINGYELLLNGEVFRPMGFNLVSEDRYTGNSLPLYRIKEDIALMKSLGANFARVSHMPLPKDYLNLLDENGIMTFEEVALWGKDAWATPDHPMPKAWLEKMVATKYNHPSIVGWSVGNEIGSTKANPHVFEYIKGAIEHAKKLDPSRLAVYVSNTAQNNKKDAAIFSDLIMLNIYGGWGKALEKTHKNFPKKAIFMSEFGHQLNKESPNEGTIDGKKMIDALRNKPYTIGGSLWTLNDYRSKWHGGSGWATGPSQNRAWGIVNAYRQKKRAYYTFMNEYAPITATNLSFDSKKSLATFSFKARGKLDLPAYTLKDYFLKWQAKDKYGKTITEQVTPLPTIKPDEHAYKYDWEVEQSPARITIELTDNLGYSLLTKHIDNLSPKTPSYLTIYRSAKTNRIEFDPAWNSEEHYLRYTNDGEKVNTPATIDGHIDIKVTKNKSYEAELIARNSYGETVVKKFFIYHSEQDLPPVVFDIAGSKNAIFIGYETSEYDYLYDIQLGSKSGHYKKTISFNTKGSFKIPNLEKGTYYLQMRKRAQHGFVSQWTREFRVEVGEDSRIKMEFATP